ncbi:MAG: ornithine carbamoyltransferase [Planctomycetota bacterium]|nr:MAG: ornithine carbamoyltransferase [Planctomycetota bacterium]
MTDIGKLSVSSLVSIEDLTLEDIQRIHGLALRLKKERYSFPKILKDLRLAMLFEKESLRTRMTFDVGMQDLGGSAIYLDHQEVRLGQREGLKDIGRNLARWVHGIVARTYRHRTVEELAKHSGIPVINGLTDLLHPCQGLTDFFTLTECWGSVQGRTLAYVGDGNNTCHSLIYCGARLGAHVRIGSPEGYEPNSKVVNHAMNIAKDSGSVITILEDPEEAVRGADCIYTDVWASMGQEEETEERAEIFSKYRVDAALMKKANPGALFLHCLPAHRGHEVKSEVIDSEASKVFQNAENRLHVQKAVLSLLLQGQRPAE